MDDRLVPAAMTLQMRRLSARSGRRRRFETQVCIGEPDGEMCEIATAGLRRLDVGQATDLVIRALESVDCDDPLVWIRRPGELEALDSDWAWCAAARMAFAVDDRRLRFFHVVTRHGWHDLLGGARTEWKRVRTHQV